MTQWSRLSGNPAQCHSEGAGNPPSLLDIPLRNIYNSYFFKPHPDHPDFNGFSSNRPAWIFARDTFRLRWQYYQGTMRGRSHLCRAVITIARFL